MSADPIAQWLRMLGTLTASSGTVAEAHSKLATYEPLLRAEFPPQAFTRDSLTAVAHTCKYFPTYGELYDALGTWWRDNRPTPRTLPPPPHHTGPPHDPEQWLKFWQTRRNENFDRSKGRPPRDLLNLIHARAPEVFNWIVTHDDLAKREASHSTRPSPEAPRYVIDTWYQNDWDNAEGVRRLVRRCQIEAPQLLNMLRATVTRWAPQHSHLVPDTPPPPLSPQAEDERPKPRYLTPEQLDQLNPLPDGAKRAPEG